MYLLADSFRKYSAYGKNESNASDHQRTAKQSKAKQAVHEEEQNQQDDARRLPSRGDPSSAHVYFMCRSRLLANQGDEGGGRLYLTHALPNKQK